MEHQDLYEDLASYKLHLGQARSFLQDNRTAENRWQKQPIFAPQKPLSGFGKFAQNFEMGIGMFKG